LGVAVSGETHEFQEMYPAMIEEAKKEGNKAALTSFDWANKVEQIHAGLYQKAIDVLKAKKALAEVHYYVCSVCGNTVEGSAPDKCPVCGAAKKAFNKVE
jgi:rubrerythrin